MLRFHDNNLLTFQEIYHKMNEVLARIHQVDVKKAGLEDYGKHGKIDLRK
jgi:aminoglycoside phosphotransferase (APT) family kinase protein